jgi:hypothetical protein
MGMMRGISWCGGQQSDEIRRDKRLLLIYWWARQPPYKGAFLQGTAHKFKTKHTLSKNWRAAKSLLKLIETTDEDVDYFEKVVNCISSPLHPQRADI